MREINPLATDLLSLRRSTYLDELRNAVPVPRSSSPPDIGLPRWKRTALDKKIPAAPSPQEVILTRRKLGEPLRLDLQAARDDAATKRFDMSDPYNRETPLPYEGLHDPHLARFFRASHAVREFLVKAGLLTEELGVKCTLKEYNDYRNYLRTMHGKAMRTELEKRDEAQREKLMLEVAFRQALKEAERLKKSENRARLLNELERQKEQKLQELFEKWKRSSEHLRSLSHSRRQVLEEKIAEAKAKREIFEQKRQSAAKREQQHVLSVLKCMHERDGLLARALEQKGTRMRESKMEEAIDRFEKKKREQEEAVEREARVRECAEKIKKAFLEEYEGKLARSRQKLQDLFVEKRRALEKSRTAKKRKFRKRDTCCCRAQ